MAKGIEDGASVVQASHLKEDAEGALVTFAPPLANYVEMSLTVIVLPAAIGQQRLAAMSERDIRNAEFGRFRPEVEDVLAEAGNKLLEWHPMRLASIGGRHALLASYLYSDSGRRMSKRGYYVYLGTKSIQLHIYEPDDQPSDMATALKAMVDSIVIAIDRI